MSGQGRDRSKSYHDQTRSRKSKVKVISGQVRSV